MKESVKKTEIRQNALKLFKEKGYENVTVNEIAAASGISKNTFYYHFSGKEAIMKDFYHPTFLQNEEFMIRLMNLEDPLEQLKCIYEELVLYTEDIGREVMKLGMIKALSVDYARTITCREKGPRFLMFEGILQRAMDKKEIRDDHTPEELAKVMLVMFIGCVQIWSASVNTDLRSMLNQTSEMILIR